MNRIADLPAGRPPVSDPRGSPREISPARARYALGLLLAVYIVNFIDRSILNILLQPIKEEFGVSDTYLGFLSGIAFALFYTFMGLPIARWADRGSRRTIIALMLFIWSGMTVASGLARSFTHLALARVGVAIGEAGCTPPAHSLISDYFPPQRRATAMSLYALGIPIGAGLGFLIGGWINEYFNWRMAFIVVGAPGVLLALVVRLTLPEPERGAHDPTDHRAGAQQSLADVIRYMIALRSFRHIAMGAALHAFYGYGAATFIAAFFVRSHGIPTGELGTWLAGISCTGGVLGTFLGGYLSDRFAVADRRWYVWVPALSTVFYIPFAFFLYLWPDGNVALMLWFPGSLFGGMYLGPTFALTQALVRPQMRALASAILLFIINIIGLGLGPQVVGILSDLLQPRFGVEALRYSLLTIVVTFAAWSVAHYALAARTLESDLDT